MPASPAHEGKNNHRGLKNQRFRFLPGFDDDECMATGKEQVPGKKGREPA
jgi:hypothetical protein